MSNLNVEELEDSESCNTNLTSCNDADGEENENDSVSAQSDKSEEPRNQFRHSIYHKMYVFCRELCFCFLLVLTYAAFQNNSPKVSKSPAAYPFFPKGSLVKDWFHGELSKAIELASESDLAFVMYYAPWDAESQNVKNEFSITAQHMYKYIHFAAINCWQPGSECRQQYSKVYGWPVLMAYPAHGRGIQYRGSRTYPHMLRFLNSVSKPLTRITSLAEIPRYSSFHDAVVVGYVDAKLGSSEYGVFYSTALRYLERDPFGEVLFLVYTGNKFETPALELYLWNETLQYPINNEWRPEAIMTWLNDNLHQVSLWVFPPGGKSQTLSTYVQPGPALILFTPRNPLYSHTDYYTVLHDVALEYYNCENSLTINAQKSLIRVLREESKRAYENLKTKCLVNKNPKKDKIATVITYDVHKLWLNNTCDFTKTEYACVRKGIKDTCANIVLATPTVLNKEAYKEIHITKEKEDINSNKTEKVPETLNIFTDDPRSPENLQLLDELEICHMFRIAHKIQPALFASTLTPLQELTLNVSGAACHTNMTMSMIALDSLQHHVFAEALGIDILNKIDKTAVVILNPAFETHHVMQEPFNITNLRRFILNFANGGLNRSLSSTVLPRLHTHQYKHHVNCHNFTAENICIPELTTDSFLPTVMNPNTAVIVLYYSTKCTFCSSVSHSLLTAARTLAPITSLRFTRIDGDSHALPWEYSMHHYPSILYFPTRRKSESRVFPQNVPITVPNIVSFILANAESGLKLQVMWTLCKQAKFNEDLLKCSSTVRTECLALIGKLLRKYRYTNDVQSRTKVLKQLQHLRSLHFQLSDPQPTNMEIIQKYISLYTYNSLNMTPIKMSDSL